MITVNCITCGQEFETWPSQLRGGNCPPKCAQIAKSKAMAGENNPAFKHGANRRYSRTKEYRAFIHARDRCNRPTDNRYYCYGARGIKFLFTSFQEFLADVGACPAPDLTLDRKDNNRHYEPGNLKWSTRHEQAQNRRPRSEWRFKKANAS